MDLSTEQARALLELWAIDALDEAMLAAVDRAVARDAALADEAGRLRAAAGWLGQPLAEAPPRDLRGSVLAGVAASSPRRSVGRRPGSASEPDVYRAQVEVVAGLLEGLGAADWDLVTRPTGWTVHQLVLHLLEVERYTAAVLGVPGAADPSSFEAAHDHLGMTLAAVASADGRDPLETEAAWAATAGRTVAWLGGRSEADLDARVGLHHLDIAASTALIVRGFELWAHADDIRGALGLGVVPPPAAHLNTMADRSVGSLALALPGPADAPAAWARVVLTGAGGGTWDLGRARPDDPAARPDALVVADLVDYCRVVTGRADLADLVCTTEGDPHLVAAMFDVARAVAV